MILKQIKGEKVASRVTVERNTSTAKYGMALKDG